MQYLMAAPVQGNTLQKQANANVYRLFRPSASRKAFLKAQDYYYSPLAQYDVGTPIMRALRGTRDNVVAPVASGVMRLGEGAIAAAPPVVRGARDTVANLYDKLMFRLRPPPPPPKNVLQRLLDSIRGVPAGAQRKFDDIIAASGMRGTPVIKMGEYYGLSPIVKEAGYTRSFLDAPSYDFYKEANILRQGINWAKGTRIGTQMSRPAGEALRDFGSALKRFGQRPVKSFFQPRTPSTTPGPASTELQFIPAPVRDVQRTAKGKTKQQVQAEAQARARQQTTLDAQRSGLVESEADAFAQMGRPRTPSPAAPPVKPTSNPLAPQVQQPASKPLRSSIDLAMERTNPIAQRLRDSTRPPRYSRTREGTREAIKAESQQAQAALRERLRLRQQQVQNMTPRQRAEYEFGRVQRGRGVSPDYGRAPVQQSNLSPRVQQSGTQAGTASREAIIPPPPSGTPAPLTPGQQAAAETARVNSDYLRAQVKYDPAAASAARDARAAAGQASAETVGTAAQTASTAGTEAAAAVAARDGIVRRLYNWGREKGRRAADLGSYVRNRPFMTGEVGGATVGARQGTYNQAYESARLRGATRAEAQRDARLAVKQQGGEFGAELTQRTEQLIPGLQGTAVEMTGTTARAAQAEGATQVKTILNRDQGVQNALRELAETQGVGAYGSIDDASAAIGRLSRGEGSAAQQAALNNLNNEVSRVMNAEGRAAFNRTIIDKGNPASAMEGIGAIQSEVSATLQGTMGDLGKTIGDEFEYITRSLQANMSPVELAPLVERVANQVRRNPTATSLRNALNQELATLAPESQAILRRAMKDQKYLATPATRESVIEAAQGIRTRFNQFGETFESVNKSLSPFERQVVEASGVSSGKVDEAVKAVDRARDTLAAARRAKEPAKGASQEVVNAYNKRITRAEQAVERAEKALASAERNYVAQIEEGVLKPGVAEQLAKAQEARLLQEGAARSGARGRTASRDLESIVKGEQAMRVIEQDQAIMRAIQETKGQKNITLNGANGTQAALNPEQLASLEARGIQISADGKTLSMKPGSGGGGVTETTRTTEVANKGGSGGPMDAPVQQVTELGAPVAGQGASGGFGEFLRNLTPGQAMALGGAGGFGVGALAS